MAAWLRGHKQRKLNDRVYSFLLFVYSRPRYQAEFKYIESSLLMWCLWFGICNALQLLQC